MTERPFLSIVIPACNEAANLKTGALRRVARDLAAQAYACEVIVDDRGSEDNTAAPAEAFARAAPHVRVLPAPRRGQARAVAAGPLDGHALIGVSVTAAFDVELLFVARRVGCRLREVPVAWDRRRTQRVKLPRDSWRGLRDLVPTRPADWRGDYGHAPLADQRGQP